jgi:hypothetical protein
MERKFILIDGNNLAHYLFKLGQGHKVTPENDRQMIINLSNWAYNQGVDVELFLDPRKQKPEDAQHIRVFVAEPGKKADDLISEYIAYHVHQQERCMVITNDGELRDRASEYKVLHQTVFDFVKNAYLQSIQFANVPDLIPLGTLGENSQEGPFREQLLGDSQPIQKLSSAPGLILRAHRASSSRGNGYLQQEYDRLFDRTLALRGVKQARCPVETSAAEKLPEPAYLLDLRNWPLKQGGKFLFESFCQTHRDEVKAMVGDLNSLQSDDLPELAALLLENCAEEPDFILRGGCLMDRIRLVLLQARGAPLTQSELIARCNAAPSDIRRKLHRNIGRWLCTMS